MKNHIVLPLGELLQSGNYDENRIRESFNSFKCPLEIDLEDFLLKNSIGETRLVVYDAELADGNFAGNYT